MRERMRSLQERSLRDHRANALLASYPVRSDMAEQRGWSHLRPSWGPSPRGVDRHIRGPTRWAGRRVSDG